MLQHVRLLTVVELQLPRVELVLEHGEHHLLRGGVLLLLRVVGPLLSGTRELSDASADAASDASSDAPPDAPPDAASDCEVVDAAADARLGRRRRRRVHRAGLEHRPRLARVFVPRSLD